MKHSHLEDKDMNQDLVDKSKQKQETGRKVKEEKSGSPKRSLKRTLITLSFETQISRANMGWKACEVSYV